MGWPFCQAEIRQQFQAGRQFFAHACTKQRARKEIDPDLEQLKLDGGSVIKELKKWIILIDRCVTQVEVARNDMILCHLLLWHEIKTPRFERMIRKWSDVIVQNKRNGEEDEMGMKWRKWAFTPLASSAPTSGKERNLEGTHHSS